MNKTIAKCTICDEEFNGIDEDLVLICDGCENEIHIYCLNPPLFDIPEGDWFCPECSQNNDKNKIESYLSQFHIDNEEIDDMNARLFQLQQNRERILGVWSLKYIFLTKNGIFTSEFNSSDDLIGSSVHIKDYINNEVFTGRILYKRQHFNRYEHLIQFFSGCDNRNSNLLKWICLDEVPCTVGVEVVWGRIIGYPWWPALKYYHSGMDIYESLIRTGNSVAYPINNQNILSNYHQSNSNRKRVYLSFYGDDSTAVMDEEEARLSVVPFNKRSADLKPNSKNVRYLLLMYSL